MQPHSGARSSRESTQGDSPARRRRQSILRLVLVCLLVVTPLGIGAWRVCAKPVTLTPLMGADDGASLPRGAGVQPLVASPTSAARDRWLLMLRRRLPPPTRRDRVLYWLHAVYGAALDRARCDTMASGVQWVKAAVHARSLDEAERVAGGIRSAVTRSADPPLTAQGLCLAASPRVWASFDHVALIFALAGVYCSPAMAPAGTG